MNTVITNDNYPQRVFVANNGSGFNGKVGTITKQHITPMGLMFEVEFDQPVNDHKNSLFFKGELEALKIPAGWDEVIA